jgi:4-hydroxybenzoate polyprenyltransferase
MYVIRYFLITPIVSLYGYNLSSTNLSFGVLVASVLFLTAAAGIINDYFDRKADLHNNPKSVLIGTKINRRLAIILHSVLNLFGVVAGFYVTWKAGHFWYGIIFVVMSVIFYLYSAVYKKKLLTGNILISIIIAGIVFLPWLQEFLAAKNAITTNFPSKMYHHIMIVSIGLSISGFLLNLAREIAKDIIDFRGDYQAGSRTLPIVMGEKASRTIISIILLFTLFFIVFSWYTYLGSLSYVQYDIQSLMYLLLTIIIPIFILSLRVYNMKKKKQIQNLCKVIELTMLAGIMFCFVIYLNIIL